ncbi:receptor homology region, transmembrane domain- and RING domain-containing protein 2-like [Cynara cardunculus var. scolymus]|uniref:receptor homology region, transmembrane domain- and RING domain-containing protein 2-like n=1 Tax=Cynara cardunculus var. scolymus TaxID=59895 RepID=UPI000D628BEC|nr:receptor homology region, transmembrane domain- and RING domain-containing protein 2-like [Cynara cardunculus var. scolymus]
MLNLWVFLCTLSCLMVSRVFANVVLRGNGVTLSFTDIAANFARPVNGSGEHGTLFLASPLDACSPLINSAIEDDIISPYVLIIRGGCPFKDKVRRAQDAGFKAAIIYNNDDSFLVAMAGNPGGIHIHAVFVSNDAGCKLQDYVGKTEIEVWLIQNNENSIWSIMAISFILLLAMSAALASCFFVRRRDIRQELPRVRGFNGMSRRLVKAMPSLFFTTALEDNCTSATCAICLEDYDVGDKLRILPCHHKFHTLCVDAWLTSCRTFCPVCKRDANTTISDPPATERTPLLSSSSLSSSSHVASRPMVIGHLSPSSSNTPSSQQSFHESLNPRSSLSSSATISNPFIIPSSLPLNSVYMPFYASPRKVSSSYSRSSIQQSCSPCHSESMASSSWSESTQSLPEC